MSLHLYDLLFYHRITAILQIFVVACTARKLEIKQTKSKNLSTISTELLPKLTLSLQKVVTLAQEKGASSWLTVADHGFSLYKTAFWDALALKYGWMPLHAPSHCTCGTSFSVDHVLSC